MLNNNTIYIYDHALRNVIRNKGRNLLLGAIITTIVTTTIVSLSIFQTTSAMIADYKNRFSSEVTISAKRQQISAKNESSPTNATGAVITPQQYIDFARSVYLDHSVLTDFINVASKNLTGIDQKDGYTGPTMRLLGNSWREFDDGQRKMIDGRMPQAENECVISSDLAQQNRLSAGEAMTVFASLETGAGEKRDVTYTLSIVGIYFDATEKYAMGQSARTPYLNKRNEILTSYDTVMAAEKDGESGVGISAIYYLKNPGDLSAFVAELRAKGLDPSFSVKTDQAGYQKLISPVEGLKSISLIFIGIILAFGAAILILLSILAIRERKYEIGVLRAMGMKKEKVALLLWIEMLAVTWICLILGIIIGAVVMQPVSSVLLSWQVTEAATQLSEIHVNIGFQLLLEIVAITLLLVSIAGVLSISKITKYEPIKILMERD
jgi:putative ABC transport system permease protein